MALSSLGLWKSENFGCSLRRSQWVRWRNQSRRWTWMWSIREPTVPWVLTSQSWIRFRSDGKRSFHQFYGKEPCSKTSGKGIVWNGTKGRRKEECQRWHWSVWCMWGMFRCAAENTSVPESYLRRFFSRKQGNVQIWASIRIILCKFDLWLSEGQWSRALQGPGGTLAVSSIQMTFQTLNTATPSPLVSVIVLSVWLIYWSLVVWQFIYPHHRLISCIWGLQFGWKKEYCCSATLHSSEG